jgi:uncharacterized membrane protein (UPF0136 family)
MRASKKEELIVKLAQGVMIVYAVLTVMGGIMGFKSKGSAASLVASLVSGALLVIGCLLSAGNPTAGYGLGTCVALVLAIFFAMRWKKNGPKMPAVMMLPLSVIVLLVLLWVMLAAGVNESKIGQ